MRKDDSGPKTEWCKHTKNAKLGRRGVNKKNRKAVKEKIRKGDEK